MSHVEAVLRGLDLMCSHHPRLRVYISSCGTSAVTPLGNLMEIWWKREAARVCLANALSIQGRLAHRPCFDCALSIYELTQVSFLQV